LSLAGTTGRSVSQCFTVSVLVLDNTVLSSLTLTPSTTPEAPALAAPAAVEVRVVALTVAVVVVAVVVAVVAIPMVRGELLLEPIELRMPSFPSFSPSSLCGCIGS
jgi:hypothetical protein